MEAQYQGQGSWYAATVKYITGPTTLYLLYDDGDEECNADVKYVRAVGGGAPAGAGAGKAVEVEPAAGIQEKEGESVYKVKDKVEALYYNGSTWYPATVGAVHNVAGQWHYDVEYEDGDREKRVHESKVRKQESATTTTTTTTAPAPAPAHSALRRKRPGAWTNYWGHSPISGCLE